MPNDANPLSQLLDLTVRVQNCAKVKGQKDVRADLRIHQTEIEGPDGELISVQLKKATLEMELAGLEAVPRSRFGDPVLENKIVEKQTTNLRTNLQGKATVGAGFDLSKVVPANLKLSANAIAEAKATSVHTSRQEITEYRVKARGGDTWEVCEPKTKTTGKKDKPLDGTYLSDDVLCKVAPQKGACGALSKRASPMRIWETKAGSKRGV